MKGFFAVFFLCMFVGMTGITTADIPNLVGNWTGPYVEYGNQSFSEKEGGFFFLNITEQKDRIFVGNSSYVKADGTPVMMKMAGVISADGTELSVVEQNNGYSHGKVLGPDAFELTYLTDKDPISVAVDQFNRIS
jgi:hypothetical protein